MELKALLKKLDFKCIQGNIGREITCVAFDSRKVSEGSLNNRHKRQNYYYLPR